MRKTNTKPAPSSLRKAMEVNAKAYNKYLTAEYLKGLRNIALLRLTHPTDRPGFARQLHQQGRMSEKKAREFTKTW